MKFKRREVKSVQVSKGREIIYSLTCKEDESLTAFAHEDDESGAQLLGLELVNKSTGEVTTQRINLPTSEIYILSVIEILDVESGIVQDVEAWRPKQ